MMIRFKINDAVSEIMVLLIDHKDRYLGKVAEELSQYVGSVMLIANKSIIKKIVLSLKPDVAIINSDMKSVEGIEILEWFCSQDDFGVLTIGEAQGGDEHVTSLEIGADDHVLRTVTTGELLARIWAVYRRTKRYDLSVSAAAQELSVGPIRLNLMSRLVTTDHGRSVRLTAAQFEALRILMEAGGQLVTRDILSESVLQRPWTVSDRSVDQLMSALRQKLPLNKDGSQLIRSIRGAGYLLQSVHLETSNA